MNDERRRARRAESKRIREGAATQKPEVARESPTSEGTKENVAPGYADALRTWFGRLGDEDEPED